MTIQFAACFLAIPFASASPDDSSGLVPIDIVNGEFDRDADGSPSDWTVVSGTPDAIHPEPAPSPKRHVEWTDGTNLHLPADDGRTLVSQRLPARSASGPNEYRVGFNARSVGRDPSTVECLVRDEDGETISRGAVVVDGAEWSRRFLELRIPAEALAGPIDLVLRNRSAAAGSGVLIDRISIARVDPDEPGFLPLFNGTDLDGWTGSRRGFGVEDGAIRTYPEREGGNLFTVDEFEDFVLRFEFRLEPGANNGIAIRSPLNGDPAYDGLEIQVLETGHPRYDSILPWQTHGSIYGIAPALRGYLLPAGAWNQEEIRVEGRRVVVVLNGKMVLDVDLDDAISDGTESGRPHPGTSRRKGHIGFCGHGDVVWFRDLRVRPISGTSPPSSR